MKAEPLLYPISEAQKMIGGVSRSTIYNLEARGEIEFVHIGRRALVTDASLRAYVERLVAAEPTSKATTG